jgi:acylglycerol lipase
LVTTEHVEGKFAGAAGGQIHWQGWVPDGAVSGVVVIVHGLAEHGGRYAHVGRRLAADGYAVYAADHRGHGRSDGVRGNIARMSQAVVDLETMVRSAAQRHAGLPMFLYGHSMGALVALAYATSGRPAELNGMILTGAAVDIAVGSRIERLAARALSATVPNLGILQLDSAAVSRDPEVVRDYDTDVLNYRGKTRVRTGAEMLAAIDMVRRRLDRLTMPLLLMHGSADRLTAPSGTQVIADGAGSADVTVKIYDGWYHELHNEPEKETVFDDIVMWLKGHG